MPTEIFDLLEEYSKLNKPYVVYRIPGNSVLNVMIQESEDLNVVHDFSEQGFVMAPFKLDRFPILIRPDQCFEYEYSPKRTVSTFFGTASINQDLDQAKHESLVAKAITAIRMKDLEKVVVARKMEFHLEQKPFQIFENLLYGHPQAFCYFWFHPQIGFWLGASPELLIELENSSLTTFSLAGTKSYEKGKLPEWGSKEIREQKIVTSYILKQLSDLCIDADASNSESVRAGSLWHLKTIIKAQVPENMTSQLLEAIHPTPAVAGIPKATAMDFIDVNERLDRKFYSGYLGELNLGATRSTRLYVNLRCMEWRNETATLYVGGGITAGSDPKEEWQETVAKSNTILDAMFNYHK